MIRKFYNTYEELFDSLGKQTQSQSIFRGQSNHQQFWEINSSFNRKYDYQFHEISLRLRDYLGNYHSIKELNELAKLSDIDLFIYLQHYGFPTPLIDFTYNPLIAFYFACSEISYSVRSRLEFFRSNSSEESQQASKIALKCSQGCNLSPSEFDFLYNFQKDYFVSLIQLETEKLTSKRFLIDIKENDYQYDYDFLQDCRKNKLKEGGDGIEGYIFSVFKPNNNKINFNLERQEGAFLYFDCSNSSNESSNSLDEFFNIFGFDNVITYHLVPKPRLNLCDSAYRDGETIFKYLKGEKIYGKELFNNLQGLLIDYLNFETGE